MALSKDRMIKRRDGVQFTDPVAAATILYAGALACLDASGNAVPGDEATTLIARGVVEEGVDNSGGAAGDLTVNIRRGVYNFKNSTDADEIDRTHIGSQAYIVDDETVAATDGSSSRSAAGKIVDVDSDGVWVDVGA